MVDINEWQRNYDGRRLNTYDSKHILIGRTNKRFGCLFVCLFDGSGQINAI